MVTGYLVPCETVSGSIGRIDQKLSVLEIMTADLNGRLVNSRMKQFNTLRSIDAEEAIRITDNDRT